MECLLWLVHEPIVALFKIRVPVEAFITKVLHDYIDWLAYK